MVLILIMLYTPTTFYEFYNEQSLPNPENRSLIEINYLMQKNFWVLDVNDHLVSPVENLITIGAWFLGFMFMVDMFTRIGWLPQHWGKPAYRVIKKKIREGREEYRSWKHRNRTERIQDTGEMREWHRKGN
jgi:hypothetical protein